VSSPRFWGDPWRLRCC